MVFLLLVSVLFFKDLLPSLWWWAVTVGDRHLGITFGLHVVDSSLLVSLLFRQAFSHPYISFFNLLVNVFSVTIRECGSTLYVGLARAVPPTNTNFQLTFLLTHLQEALYEDLAV